MARWMIIKIRHVPMLLICAVLTMLVVLDLLTKEDGHADAISTIIYPKEIVFLLILCEVKTRRAQDKSVNRQIEQARVLIKSAVALTSVNLRFTIVADSENLFDTLVNSSLDWPAHSLSKLEFEYLPVWYPPERSYMRNMFRECATERLFVPSMLQKEDSVIYIDTDIIFMRPPEHLWAHFYNFDSKQLAAMAPCLFHYGTNKNSKTPYYGSTGLNAGIMLMNLTRMRSFPEGGWIEANMRAFDQYTKDISLADQDILNIVFNKYPDLLYELGCNWNYRAFQCSNGKNECPVTDIEGVSLIHGNALSFVSGKENKIKAVYDSWRDHSLWESLSQLYSKISRKLDDVSDLELASKCSQLNNIDHILTEQLRRYTHDK